MSIATRLTQGLNTLHRTQSRAQAAARHRLQTQRWARQRITEGKCRRCGKVRESMAEGGTRTLCAYHADRLRNDMHHHKLSTRQKGEHTQQRMALPVFDPVATDGFGVFLSQQRERIEQRLETAYVRVQLARFPPLARSQLMDACDITMRGSIGAWGKRKAASV